MSFAETLRRLRNEKGLTQQQFADLLYVDRTTIVKWENGTRMPDAFLLARISKSLGVEMDRLIPKSEITEEKPKVILVDDEKIILTGGMPILEEALPEADIIGFDKPTSAIDFAKNNRIALAFLDIELGKISGLDLCRELLDISPRTNIIFLTSYIDYSFDAWSTGACGFLLKPLTVKKVKNQLTLLRYPLS